MCNCDPETNLIRIASQQDIKKLLQIENKALSVVGMASGQLVSVDIEVPAPFKLGNQCFNEKFLALKPANFLICGDLFFKKHNIQICQKTTC